MSSAPAKELFDAAEVTSLPPWLDPKIPSHLHTERVLDTDDCAPAGGVGSLGRRAFAYVVAVREDATNRVLNAWSFPTAAARDEKAREVWNARRSATQL